MTVLFSRLHRGRGTLRRLSLLVISCALMLTGGCFERQNQSSAKINSHGAQGKVAPQQELSGRAREFAKQNSDFVARFAKEADPNKKWEMLEAHSNELQAEWERDLVDFDHFQWIDQQKEKLLALFPQDHPAKIIRRAYAAVDTTTPRLGPLTPTGEELSALAASADELIQKGGAQSVEKADLASLTALKFVAGMMVRANSSEQIGAHLPAFETLHQVCTQRHDLELAFRLSGCLTAAEAYFLSGETAETAAVMKEYVAIARAEASAAEPHGKYGAPNLRDSALLNYGWYLFEIGRNQDALLLAKQNGGPASTARAEWYQLAGWANIALNRYKDAEEEYKSGLDAEDARRNPLQGILPRKVRDLLRGGGTIQRDATSLVVDLYIAQIKTNPQEASKIPSRYSNWDHLMWLGTSSAGFGDRVRSPEYSQALYKIDPHLYVE